MKNCLFLLFLIPFLVSSCLTTSDLIEATPLGKGKNSIDFRGNGQLIFPIQTSNQGGDINIPGVMNAVTEYSRGISNNSDIGVAVYYASYGISINWKQNFINNEKYAFALKPSAGYNGLFKDQFGLDVLNTFKISERLNVLLNASLYGNGLIQGENELSFLSESFTAGITMGNKHKFKFGLTAANFIQHLSNSENLPIYAGVNLAYQLSW